MKVGDKVIIMFDICWNREGEIGYIKGHSGTFRLWFVSFEDKRSFPYYEEDLKLCSKPGEQLMFSFMLEEK